MIEIDGSIGEGGGQIVRSSLALSIITGKPFQIYQIRANRKKPGLLNQHLTAVNAAAEISAAKTSGVKLGSSAFTFDPTTIKAGNYRFDIGTAGSTMLVFQTILPPLMLAKEPSSITLEGGTHNPMAPPFEFIKNTFLPLLERMDVTVRANLNSYGFYPQGGGSLKFDIQPTGKLIPLHLKEKGAIKAVNARALVVKLPDEIGNRELRVLESELSQLNEKNVLVVEEGRSAGNVVTVEIVSDALTETVTAIGERGVKAEQVAHTAAVEANHYLASQAAVGEHLCDQLLLPMALAGEGSFLTSVLSAHTTTNIAVIQKFLNVEIETESIAPGLFSVKVHSRNIS
ncbi:MAG: RNA 3'-terminal phosphate cyclase [Candidatus Melainabacteria bacterium]|nr:RNA 3'-terminal phosphate cyclase [Candidatus Melainabacteria bacterium]